MKALTVRQPWAWAIGVGVKPIENRTRGTNYRGPLAIHAGKGWSARGHQSPLIRDDWARIIGDAGDDYDSLCMADPIFASGSVIAVAQLVDSHVAEPLTGPWTDDDGVERALGCCCPNRYAEYHVYSHDQRDPARDVHHLVLADVVLLDDPVPCRGALGFWNLPTDVDEIVTAQLRGAA